MMKPAPLYENKNYSNIIGRPDNDNSLDYLFWKFRMNLESCWGLAMLVYRFYYCYIGLISFVSLVVWRRGNID